jgi:hypothetical protein
LGPSDEGPKCPFALIRRRFAGGLVPVKNRPHRPQ